MQFLPKEDGQGLAEYAFILVLVAMMLIVLLAAVGTQIVQTYQYIIDQLGLL